VTEFASEPAGRREVLAWAFYDFANSGYTTVVLTTIYSAYFVAVVAGAVDTRSPGGATLLWTFAVAVANFCVLLSGPVLGAIADHLARKKAFLLFTTVSCVLATALLGLAGPGDVALAMGLLIVSGIAFASGENPVAAASYIAGVIRLPIVTLGSALGFLLVYVVARWMFGRFNRAAPLLLWAAVFLFVFGAYSSPGLKPLAVATFAVISATASTYLAVRHGLLAFVTLQFIQQVSLQTVVTLDPTAWYFPPTAIFLSVVAALTVFGIKTSTDQKLLPSRT